ncbi:RagB/SusD family nutrient uptake outer membrane protein [Tunicatimonas pelagia]|uniref:RagB/SusD family nutrient uptake outer membrane protein n=1 Tax=Tunicatimonas pelagia TaxID=931531 RepID=UPI002665ED54|nr:RagB/SusD family nutrient uptake outer membrane protein [Tunicatimonas pelagia]WKN44933.1 RagB/SusD family nutrient uptake outer membrane protein [Tunicatimonas pelagia]
MKKLLYFILIIGVAACDDFLEEEPQDSLTVLDFYNNAQDAIAAINAAYDGFQHLDYFGFNYPMILNISGADAIKGGFGAGDRPGYLEFGNYNVTAENTRSLEFYRSAWGGVNRANGVLVNVGDMVVDSDFSQELKDRILGEAHFLRAIHYYNLVLGFGGMPLYEEVPSVGDEPLPRTSIEETWDFIIADFQAAAMMLPATYDAANQGRATSGAANAMLARIAALQGRWDDVLAFINLVENSEANYQLAEDYGSNFDGTGNNNSESIFEIQYTLTNTSLNVWNEAGDWNSFGLSRYASPQVDGSGWAFMSPSEDLVQDYEEGDLRLPATIYREGDPYGPDTFDPARGSHLSNAGPYGLKKYTNLNLDGTNNNGFDINWKVIRFGEILLLRAEAENELNGPTEAALAPLNQIRARAGLAPINATNSPGLDQNTLRDIILQERRIELAFEGVRFYDLVYRDRAIEILGPQGYELSDNLFPIPPSELDLTGWDQN